MKKNLFILLCMLFCHTNVFSQFAIERTKREEPEFEKEDLDKENTSAGKTRLKMLQKWYVTKDNDIEGKHTKAAKRYIDKKKQKERIYVGPMASKYGYKTGPKGIRGYYDVYFYQGNRNPGPFTPVGGFCGLYEFNRFYLDETQRPVLKIFLWTKPIYLYDSIMTNKKRMVPYREYLEKKGNNPNDDVHFYVYDIWFLPQDQYKKQQAEMDTKAIEEEKNYVITNNDEAIYYQYYYGNSTHLDTVLKNSYPNYNPDNLPELMSKFSNSTVMEEIKIKYIQSRKNFVETFEAYQIYPVESIKAETITKLINTTNDFGEISLLYHNFPETRSSKEFELKAFEITKKSNVLNDMETFLQYFPNGTKSKEAQAIKTKMLADVEKERQKIEKERLDNLAKFGADGLWKESPPYESFSFILGMYYQYNVVFNDNTKAELYKYFGLYDGKEIYFVSVGGYKVINYDNKDDATKALHKFKTTGQISEKGRYFFPEYSSNNIIKNEPSKTEITPVAVDYENIKISDVKNQDKWSDKTDPISLIVGLKYEGARTIFSDGISGILFRTPEGNSFNYGVSFGGNYVSYVTQEDATYALYIYKKYGYQVRKNRK